MLVANLYNIKNTNGLFYYGSDYLKEAGALVRLVLVRAELATAARNLFPNFQIVVCTFSTMIREAYSARRRGDLLYTPTSHPLPFIDNQWIVVHDGYPFIGTKGRIKRFLLKLSLSGSRCRVAFINESETRPFVQSLGVGEKRLIYAPNKMPAAPVPMPARPAIQPGKPIRVGLVGTDSRKKNYEELLGCVSGLQRGSEFQFVFYGHRTPYLEELEQLFNTLDLELIESDACGLEQFLAGVDVMASVADKEGFGRPIAAALMSQVPCFLLTKPVFREFFAGAHLSEDVTSLVAAMSHWSASDAASADTSPFVPPAKMMRAYAQAVDQLRVDASRAPR